MNGAGKSAGPSFAPYDGRVRLVGSCGDRLELTVVGYQFPTVEHDRWDSNWLNIKISAKNDRGSWSATDASLLTDEVEDLAGWFEAIAERRQAATELEFTEPNLSFELIQADGRVRLRTWFELELRPRWAPWREFPARDLYVDLDADERDLLAAAESLRVQLREFPPRARGR